MLQIWKLPETWKNKEIEEESENNAIIMKKTEAMIKYQKQKEKDESESDEELKNWDK